MNILLIKDGFAVFAFLIVGYILFKYNKSYLAYISIFYLVQLWSIISCFYIENGIFITEEQRYSFPTGATIRLTLYNSVFFIMFIVFSRLLMKKNKHFNQSILKKNYSNFIFKVILSIIFIIISLLIFNIIKSGTFLLKSDEINRFNFWSDYAAYPKLSILYGFVYYYSFILGLVYSFNKLSNKINSINNLSIIIFIYELVYLVLQGSKFSALYLCIYFFLLPIIALKILNIKNKKSNKLLNRRSKIIILFFLVFTIFFSYYQYKYVLKVNNPMNLLLMRIFGLQGHVWWGTDLYVQQGILNFSNQLKNEISNIIKYSPTNLQVGMKFLMLLISPVVGQAYIDNNINFTMGYPAIAVVTFGKLGAYFFQIIFAFIVSLIIVYLDRKIKQKSFVRSIITAFLLFNCYYLFTMGDFHLLFNKRNTLAVIGLIIMEIILLNRKPSKDNNL